MKNKIIELKNITKKFGGTVALDNVDFELFEGEVLGLVGDNGAGKSTLIKIISGALKADKGEIFYYGEKVNLNNPQDAMTYGIETIYQDLALFPGLDFTTNIFIGREYLKKGIINKIFGVIDIKRMEEKALENLASLSYAMPQIHENVENFSGGQKQAVAIARAKLWSKRIIIMDEPTAALGVQESKKTLEMIKEFAKVMDGIIIISHNIEHIINVTDRVIVLRTGKRVGTMDFKDYENNVEDIHVDIVKLITGFEFSR